MAKNQGKKETVSTGEIRSIADVKAEFFPHYQDDRRDDEIEEDFDSVVKRLSEEVYDRIEREFRRVV